MGAPVRGPYTFSRSQRFGHRCGPRWLPSTGWRAGQLLPTAAWIGVFAADSLKAGLAQVPGPSTARHLDDYVHGGEAHNTGAAITPTRPVNVGPPWATSASA